MTSYILWGIAGCALGVLLGLMLRRVIDAVLSPKPLHHRIHPRRIHPPMEL